MWISIYFFFFADEALKTVPEAKIEYTQYYTESPLCHPEVNGGMCGFHMETHTVRLMYKCLLTQTIR